MGRDCIPDISSGEFDEAARGRFAHGYAVSLSLTDATQTVGGAVLEAFLTFGEGFGVGSPDRAA